MKNPFARFNRADPEAVAALERRLRAARSQPALCPPADLHADIMRACAAVAASSPRRRAVGRARPEPHQPAVIGPLGWVLAGTALVVLVGIMGVRLRRPESLRPTTTVLPVEESLATARAVAHQLRTSAPLQDEAARLGADVRSAADFLLANLPPI